MTLHLFRGVTLIVVLTALVVLGPVSLGAQESDALPEGVAVTRLTRDEIEVPAAPVYVGLARFTFGPGSQYLPETGTGPAVFFVESGTMTFYTDDGAVPLQSPGATPVAGTGTVVEAGQQFTVPSGMLYASHNEGAAAASVLRVVAYPAAAVPTGGANTIFERLAYGVVTELPAAPVAVELDRFTILPGASTELVAASGPRLLFVEAGTATLSTPGVTTALTTAFIDAGTESAVQNAGGEPLVVLQVSLVSASASAATPAATPAV